MTRILCYGDSNTWGFVPKLGLPKTRLPPRDRWPRAMAASLDAEAIEEGLNGRTTDLADPDVPGVGGAGLDGAAYLPACLASHLPLDCVVLMLGSNDLQAKFARPPERIAEGMRTLVRIAREIATVAAIDAPAPAILVVCPPRLPPQTHFAAMFAGAEAKASTLPALYRAMAAAEGAAFFDAGTLDLPVGEDGLHLTPAAQRRLGAAIADAIRGCGKA